LLNPSVPMAVILPASTQRCSAVFRGSPSSAQEFLEICFLEEAVTIYRMAMHPEFPLPSPIADRTFRNPEQASGFLDSQIIPEISFHFSDQCLRYQTLQNSAIRCLLGIRQADAKRLSNYSKIKEPRLNGRQEVSDELIRMWLAKISQNVPHQRLG